MINKQTGKMIPNWNLGSFFSRKLDTKVSRIIIFWSYIKNAIDFFSHLYIHRINIHLILQKALWNCSLKKITKTSINLQIFIGMQENYLKYVLFNETQTIFD